METYNQILTIDDGIEFLRSQFGQNASIMVTDGMSGTQPISFSFAISSKEFHDGNFYMGDIIFGNFHCMVAVHPHDSEEIEYREFKKPYAMFMMNKIKQRNESGDKTFTVDNYAGDYNAYLEQEFDKQIQEVEKEYYDNIVYLKDRPVPSQKGE